MRKKMHQHDKHQQTNEHKATRQNKLNTFYKQPTPPPPPPLPPHPLPPLPPSQQDSKPYHFPKPVQKPQLP